MKRNPTFYFTVALLALILTPSAIYAQNLGDSKVFSPVAGAGYPEGIAVNGILVTNHASLVPFDPNLSCVFSVFVDDKASPLP